jgi:DNA-binding NtrC family response regulator/pSer/pThr/pTyr-binding forkhead associated (FHA) protein
MQAVLVVETGYANPRVWKLSDGDAVRLGRYRTNTIVLNDPHVSRFHAEIFSAPDGWYIRNCSETNGTRLDGEPISEPTALHDDHEIRIGDCRLRFRLETNGAKGVGDTDILPVLSAEAEQELEPEPEPEPAEVGGSDSTTHLQADELTALNQFLTEALLETTVRGLVTRALSVLHRCTHADLVGFLSLDPDDPLPRVVWPAQGTVDRQLSRKLTHQALASGRMVWLAAARGDDLRSQSLAAFRDALCVPLRDGGAAKPDDTTHGALHLYRAARPFSYREVRFCQALSICLANNLTVLRTRRVLEAENARLRVSGARVRDILIGDSAPMKQLREQVARVADFPCSILITGESGVGKELVALSLHQQSRRHAGPLVAVNCAAITSSMPEAELFGHEKDAFTGATRERQGYFQQADDGTLFLDEIGELSADCQGKLLRVLETKSFRPLGLDRGEVQVNVRVVAATNRDLKQEVEKGRFRKDLFFRLGMTIAVPPLRDHAEDVPALAAYFLAGFNAEYRRNTKLSPAALKCLTAYPWPGNVRQLRGVLESAVAMSADDVLEPRDFHLSAEAHVGDDLPRTLNLEQVEAWTIRRALRKADGVHVKAAQELGIHRDTLLSKIKKYGIERNG